MKNNKYYTPNIEEFHVGFEYEEYNSKSVYDPKWGFNTKQSIFTKETWKTGYSNWDFLDKLKDDKIRIKYLDKEDIKSLGFEEIELNPERYKIPRVCGYDNGYATIVFYPDSKKINILKLETNLSKPRDPSYAKRSVFWGTVNNKSELKKVLIQIGIDYDTRD